MRSEVTGSVITWPEPTGEVRSRQSRGAIHFLRLTPPLLGIKGDHKTVGHRVGEGLRKIIEELVFTQSPKEPLL